MLYRPSPSLATMASSESASPAGVAATMKADKANRDSLAKKKSAIKADLERVTAELEEVEQMKADAEDLEDEELLAEMFAEEQRLQGLQQQYKTELASVQEASQAAAQALRQRLRRITGDRALGSSSKSTSSERSEPSVAATTVPTPPAMESSLSGAFPPVAKSFDIPPVSASYGSSGLDSSATYTAQPAASQASSYGGPGTISNMPLSASWGNPAPVQMPIPAQVPQQSYFESAPHAESQQAQQTPQYQNSGLSGSLAPQKTYSGQAGLDATAGNTDRSQVSQVSTAAPEMESYNSTPYHSSANQTTSQDLPVESIGGYMRSSRMQEPATHADSSSLHQSAHSFPEQEAESSAHLQHDLFIPGDTGRSIQPETVSKPPRPASNFSGQQGFPKTGNFGAPAAGGLQESLGSKASMMSAGSGYQADSDENSDVQLEPQRSSLDSPYSMPGHQSRDVSTAPVPESAAAEAADEGEVDAESDGVPSKPATLLGRLSNSMWGGSGTTQHESDAAAPVSESAAPQAKDTKELEAEAEYDSSPSEPTSLLGKIGHSVWGSSGTTQHESAATAPIPESAAPQAEDKGEAETEAEYDSNPSEPRSLLGKIGHTVWGSSGTTQHESAATAPVPEPAAPQAESKEESEAESEYNSNPSEPTSLLGKIGHSMWGASGTTHPESDAAAHTAEAAEAEAKAEKEAEPEAKEECHSEAESVDTQHESVLGKIGHSVWGAVEAVIPGHHSGTAAEQTESANTDQLAATAKTGTAAETEAAERTQLAEGESGYEAEEEGPVQAGPEGISQQSSIGEEANAIPSGLPESHQGFSSSGQGAQEMLHVQTDLASSKHVGDDQPGPASKRAKGDSVISRLINAFDSPRSEPLSPTVGSRGSGSAAAGTYFTGASSRDQQGGFTQGTSLSQGRAGTNSPFSATTTFRAPHSESMGSGILPEEESYQQSTRASQGSMDNLGSVASIGNQSELNNEINIASQARGLSGALPESAANLAQTGVDTTGLTGGSTAGMTAGSTAGITGGISHSMSGSLAGATGAATAGAPLVSAPLTSAPPSANWGSAPSYTPSVTPVTSYTQQQFEPTLSEPFRQGDSSSQGISAQQEFEPEVSAQRTYVDQAGPAQQEAEFELPVTETYSSQVAVPAAAVMESETPASRTHSAQGIGAVASQFGDMPASGTSQAQGMSPSELESSLSSSYSAQVAGSGATAGKQSSSGDGFNSFAQTEQPAPSSPATQSASATPVVKDNHEGFGDDAFAQFSPFGQKSKQQANPFAHQAELQPSGQQESFVGQEQPFEASAQRAPSAVEGAQVTEGGPSTSGLSEIAFPIKEQVTPTSVTGTFTARSPFQSGQPVEVNTQRLDSQQSLGAASFNEFSPRSGKGSPRRRPPPPPQGGSAFGRSTSGLPVSPTQAPQGALQGLPSDAFGQSPLQSSTSYSDPVAQSRAVPAPQAQAGGFVDSQTIAAEVVAQMPTGTWAETVSELSDISGAVSGTPLGAQPDPHMTIATGAPSQAPTPVTSVLPSTQAAAQLPGDVAQNSQQGVPMQQSHSPTAQQQGKSNSLFAGKTAFDGAVETPVDALAPGQGVVHEGAFSKATDTGTAPAVASDPPQASAAPMSEPLSSWMSFDDPGPLPPMPAPTADDDPMTDEFWAPPAPATAATAQMSRATAAPESTPVSKKVPGKPATSDPWASHVEPTPEVKAVEQQLLSKNLAGLDGLGGDAAWSNSFGPKMGKPLTAEPEPTPEPVQTSRAAIQDTTAPRGQLEPLTTAPSWMQLANSSNPFSNPFSMQASDPQPNPWATSAAPQFTPAQQQYPAPPTAATSAQSSQQQQRPGGVPPQGLGTWDAFDQPGAPVAYPAVDNSRHPDVVNKSAQQPAGANTMPQQQQYPSPPTGAGAQQAQPAFGQDWAAFGAGGQPAQQPGGDMWSAFGPGQQQQQALQSQQQPPRAAIVDSWASFDAPSEQAALGAPVASQQASQGMSNINSQDSWSAFDPNNNVGARSRAGAAAGFPPQSSSPSPQQAQQGSNRQQPQGMSGGNGNSAPQATPPEDVIEEIPVQELGLDPSLTITAKPKEGMGASQGQYDYPQQGREPAQGYGAQQPQPSPKPKRGSSAQFGSVFSSGSANSVSKLGNMFKKDKKGAEPMTDQYSGQGLDAGLPPTPRQGAGASLPPTPRGRRPAPPKPQGASEVDSWRPQSAEERQQCMDAYDHKGYGRLGGLGEVDARALWMRQNMPAESFHQVWSLSDMDSNQLLSKPEFCLFMYLMHALRNFGVSFHLPNQITPHQAAKILGLEQQLRPNALGVSGAGPSSQGYSPSASMGGNGSLQAPQQYPQPTSHQQPSPQNQNWEATGGLSPSQQQAVQELSEMGFDARQSQEALEAHTWNKNAAANWLLQGGSNLPSGPALRRSTTDRSSNAPSLGSGGGSGVGSQSMRSSGGSGTGHFSHGHKNSAGSNADWGSGNYSPSSAGGLSQPGSARTTGDSVAGSGVQFGTPSGTPRSGGGRVPATGGARLSLTVRKVKMEYRGNMEKPFFTLSVRARGGTLLEQSQDTPPGVFSHGLMISDATLVLNTPIAELPQGAVLFFEMKHWKPKEKKFSLRGWALVAVSSLVDYSGSVPQLQTGTMKLSMLQKPVDLALSRKHKRLTPEGFDLEVNVNIARGF